MSSLEEAYNQHLKDTIGYKGKHRSLWMLDSGVLAKGADDIRRAIDYQHQTSVRERITRELGITIDAFIGEHGAVDDEALERTARYAARKAVRLREKETAARHYEHADTARGRPSWWPPHRNYL